MHLFLNIQDIHIFKCTIWMYTHEIWVSSKALRRPTLFRATCYLSCILSQAKMLSILPHQKRFVVFNFNPSPFTMRCCFMICSRIFDDRYIRYMLPVSSVGPDSDVVLAAALKHFHVTSPTLSFDPQFVWASVSLVKFYALVKRSQWHHLVGLFCSKKCLSCLWVTFICFEI